MPKTLRSMENFAGNMIPTWLVQFAALSILGDIPMSAQTTEPASSPSAEPAELTALRKQFATRGLTLGRTLTDQYTSALAALERELAAAGDYDAAMATQKRRLDILAPYQAAFGDNGVSNAIVLKLSDAKTSGGVSYERAGNLLTGWRKVGGGATWDVQKVVPGAYQINITYSSTGETSGEFDFFEDSILSGSEQNRRTEIVQPTDGATTFKTIQLGPMTLARTSTRFALRVTQSQGIAALMSVKEVTLTPVAPTVPAPTSVVIDTNSNDINTLKQSHAERIKAVVRPLTDSYLRVLDKLEAELNKQGDREAISALAAERMRIRNSQADPLTGSAAPRSLNITEALIADGFTVLAENARLVPDATNSGDLFRITTGEQTITVRLLWITCPPPEPDDKAALEVHAGYFGISPEDAESVGKLARDFTSNILADKPLKILTHGVKDKSGRPYVVVLPEGMDDLASALVENGLAAISSLPEKKAPSRRTVFTPLHTLKDRESAVKARPIPPGAWGLAVK
jgi:endonuclease YncB( thermonuclease family)